MNPLNEDLFQAMLYKIASDPEVIKSVAGNTKDELWLERQEVKRWYELRIEAIPGDQYISRCTRMVAWWVGEAKTSQSAVIMLKHFLAQNQEDIDDFRSEAEEDIKALKKHLKHHYEANRGEERWNVLAEAVAECAVACLSEINEDIAENSEEQRIRDYFIGIRDFWDKFYDVAFQGKEWLSPKEAVNRQGTDSENTDDGEASTRTAASTSDPSNESQAVETCTREAITVIISGLDDRSHELNKAGGFSKIPDDFRFLGVLRLGLEYGHLTREGILLYSCLNSYCVTLLRKFFIIQRNQSLERKGIEQSDRIQELIDNNSDWMISSLQNVVKTRAEECYHYLRDFRVSSPTASRIAFESQLPNALDMALAALREAMGQAAALESSEGIELSEGLAAVMLAYAPITLSEFENQFSRSPWAFFNVSDLCNAALEGVIARPEQLIESIFDQWLEFSGDGLQIKKIKENNAEIDKCGHSESSSIGGIGASREKELDSSSSVERGDYDDPVSVSRTALIGPELIKKVKTMANRSPSEQAYACGYINIGKDHIGDVEAFYAALYEAYRADRK